MGLVLSCSPGRLLPVFGCWRRAGWPGRVPRCCCVFPLRRRRPEGTQKGQAQLPSHPRFGSSQNCAKSGAQAGSQRGPSRVWFLAPEPSCFAFADFPAATGICSLGNIPTPEPGTVSIQKITAFYPNMLF